MRHYFYEATCDFAFKKNQNNNNFSELRVIFHQWDVNAILWHSFALQVIPISILINVTLYKMQYAEENISKTRTEVSFSLLFGCNL